MRSWSVLGGALLAVSACSGGGAPDEGLLELRPVVDTSTPPCSSEAGDPGGEGETLLPERRAGRTVACLRLGPPIVTARDVRSASLSEGAEAGKPVVSVVLGRTGGRNLDAFAERSQGERLAIVVNDRLVNAPAIQARGFIGRVSVAGLPREEAVELFERLREAPPS